MNYFITFCIIASNFYQQSKFCLSASPNIPLKNISGIKILSKHGKITSAIRGIEAAQYSILKTSQLLSSARPFMSPLHVASSEVFNFDKRKDFIYNLLMVMRKEYVFANVFGFWSFVFSISLIMWSISFIVGAQLFEFAASAAVPV